MYFDHLKCILERELPQSRRTLETLKLTMGGHDTSAFLYIPKYEEPSKPSGMVLVIPEHYELTAFSHFSKKQDVDKIHDLIDKSIDWTGGIIFSGVVDWHIPSLLKLCQKRTKEARLKTTPYLWQKIEPTHSEFEWIVKPLTTEKDAKLIDENWKFRSETSLEWIQSQCENGMAYGAFPAPSDDDVNAEPVQPVSWIIAYKYGALGLLKTKEEWRGRGCAKSCINALATKLASIGIVPYVYIENFNQNSINLFEKLGYVKAHSAAWIITTPN